MKEKAVYKVALADQGLNHKTYQLLCNCGDPSHNWIIDIEMEKDFGLQMIVYGDVYYYEYWKDGTFFEQLIEKLKAFWRRLGKVVKLLCTGYLEMNADLLILDEKHLNSFINILQEGKDYCLKNKGKPKPKFGISNLNKKPIKNNKLIQNNNYIPNRDVWIYKATCPKCQAIVAGLLPINRKQVEEFINEMEARGDIVAYTNKPVIIEDCKCIL